MTPIYMTRKDNCFAACIATTLQIPIDCIPTFNTHDWPKRLREWLRSKNHRCYFTRDVPQGYAIAHCIQARGKLHCVVTSDGKVIHDPSGGQCGGKVEFYTVIQCSS